MGSSAVVQEVAEPVSGGLKLPEKRVSVGFKVPESMREHLDDLVRFYRLMAEARGKDPADVDLTFVCNELLGIGLDATWGRIGAIAGLNGMPSTPDEWEQLKRALVKQARDDAKTRGK